MRKGWKKKDIKQHMSLIKISMPGKLKVVIFMPLLLLIVGISNLYAQEDERTITGTVVFAETGEPVPGANIAIKGTTTGTITDINGIYSINANEGDVLQISFIGYKTATLVVGTASTYNVTLKQDITQLDEVVKIGYGTMRRSDLTGSVVSVTSEEINKANATSFDQVLQGRAAGVLVTQNSGQPGGGITVQIRGINSLNGNSEPLYIIDGLPVSGYTGNSTNALATINPNDIESMEVLKDASATAIYGARAANGVVIITTKRGKSGEARISYEGNYGIQQLPKYVDVLNLQEYAQFLNERQEILGWGSKPEFADPSVLGEGTNWQKEMFRPAPQQTHNLTLSGGNENTNFMLSGGILDQGGIVIGSNFKRYSFRLNVDSKTRDWLFLGASTSASRTSERITISESNLLSTAIEQSPDIPIRNPDGSWGGPSEAFGITNPIAEALDRENDQKRTQLLTNLYGELTLFKSLSFRSEFGTNISFTNKYQFTPRDEYGTVSIPVNSSRREVQTYTEWTLKNILTYKKIFAEKHDITVQAIQEARESVLESIAAYRQNFLTNTIHEVNAGDIDESQAYSQRSEGAALSYISRLIYVYNNRYTLTATFRADGSSNFGPNNKWGYFPSVAAAWRISEESFMKNVSSISNLKLRLSFGQTGNDNIGSYRYGSTMGNWPTAYGPGFLLANLPNPDVKWESQTGYNAAVDLAMFRNRIEFIAEAYLKQTDDLLLLLPMPLYTATDLDWTVAYIQPPAVNIGSLENKGLEFTLNTVNIDRSILWRSGITLSINRNKITNLVTSGSIIDESIGVETISRTIVGEPAGQLFGYQTDGLFENAEAIRNGVHTAGADIGIDPETSVWVGDIRFVNVDGNDSISEGDRVFIGNPQPKFSFGLNNSITYKNFDITLYLNGTYGNKIFNQLKRTNENPMSRRGMLASVTDYARLGLIDTEGSTDDLDNVYVINPETSVPRIVTGDPNENSRISDRYIEDGSYIRIKNLTIGYTLPDAIVSKISLARIRFYLQAQNLFTFTKYSGYDPEIGAQRQNVLKSGVDEGRYPSAQTFLFGVNVDF